jgi:hypothetical protein
VTRIAALPTLRAAGYVPHSLHGPERTWVEKNCYVDVWIELIHALGLDPTAMLPFTLAIDFDGDQWTFFKPSHDEMRDLYGLAIQELNVWQPLLSHTLEHVAAGRVISTEADAFWLPDTAGTDYRRQHTKTTIILQAIDVDARELGYFHNASYYELSGEDFARLFRLDTEPDPTYLPLYAELARLDRIERRSQADLVGMSAHLLRRHLALRPATNPIDRFKMRFESEYGVFRERGMGYYHAWAFAATRQLGAAFELAAIHSRWLAASGYPSLREPAEAFEQISTIAKTFILKAARVVTSSKTPDFSTTFSGLSEAWQRGMDAADAAIGTA